MCAYETETCPGCGEPVAPPLPDDMVGTLLAEKYAIERKLGEGGMGMVYLATQEPIGRQVCLKVVHQDICNDPVSFRRFQREAEMASKVMHPNSVEIYDFQQLPDGRAFIVMELVKGAELTDIIEADYPFEPERIIRILSQVCGVLDVGHRLKVIHRDLKPDNIMVDASAQGKDFVKVLDFGLAKSSEQAPGATQLTMAGTAIGTPEYMAPEQCMGKPVGPETDIYAVGVILYEMLAGVKPFESATMAGFLQKHVTETPLPPSRRARAGGVDPELEKLALWALKKDPKERPPSAAEFKRQLDAALPQADSKSGSISALNDLLGDVMIPNVETQESTEEQRSCAVITFDLVPPSEAKTPEGLKSYFARLVDVSEDAGGVIFSQSERELKVGFGLRKNDPWVVEHAVHCASAVLKLTPKSSAGIHYGMVSSGGQAWAHSEIADLSERISGRGQSGQILLTKDADDLIQDSETRALASIEIKGFDEPIELIEVINVVEKRAETIASMPAQGGGSTNPTMVKGANEANAAPVAATMVKGAVVTDGAPTGGPQREKCFVGMEDPINTIKDAAAQTVEKSGQVLLLAGSPGSGKSHLSQHLTETIPELNWHYVDSKKRTALAQLISALPVDQIASEYQTFIDWMSGNAFEPPAGLGPEEIIRGMVAAAQELLKLAAGEKPVGLIFDDIDQSDQRFRLIANQLSAVTQQAKVLLILNTRPLKTTPPNTTLVQLPALDADSAKALAESFGIEIDEKLQSLVQACGGVPSAIVQLCQAVSEGVIDPAELDLDAQQGLRPVYEARLDSLSEVIRETLSFAGVLGREFQKYALDQMLEIDPNKQNALEEIIQRGLLQHDELMDTLSFASTIEMQIAFERLPTNKRRDLHLEAAKALEAVGETPDIIANHLEQAGLRTQALEKLREAAFMWAERKEQQVAITCYRKACEWARGESEEASRFAEDALHLAELLGQTGRLAEIAQLLSEAGEASNQAGDKRLFVRISCEKVRLLIEKSQYAQAEKELAVLLEEGKALRDPALLSDLLGIAGESAERSGHPEMAGQRIQKAIELTAKLPESESLKRVVKHLGSLGRIELRSKNFDRALAVFKQQEEAAKKTDNPLEEARALINQGSVLHGRGDIDGSLQNLSSGADMAMQLGDLLTVAKAKHNLACLYMQKQDLEKAQTDFEESLRLSQSIGWREGVAMNDTRMRQLKANA